MADLDKVSQKDFKALFSGLIKSERQEETIREHLTPRFEKITAEREAFSLPSSETILEALMEECKG
ncbi:MAG: hypothetical protein SPK82_07885, partial [Eubacteriales bacterium]|nr:hypothetical protein [Eubacteriales bacterium]